MIGDLAIVDASVRSTLECGGSTPLLPSSSALKPASLSRGFSLRVYSKAASSGAACVVRVLG
jgi:hypothetical protein